MPDWRNDAKYNGRRPRWNKPFCDMYGDFWKSYAATRFWATDRDKFISHTLRNTGFSSQSVKKSKLQGVAVKKMPRSIPYDIMDMPWVLQGSSCSSMAAEVFTDSDVVANWVNGSSSNHCMGYDSRVAAIQNELFEA